MLQDLDKQGAKSLGMVTICILFMKIAHGNYKSRNCKVLIKKALKKPVKVVF